ncbi:MAG TPA: hypothetical protein DCX53_14695, partial [Anaerolineae bacterium]|nr:hypothetical protein [Anaerolineae bacterium]
MHRMKKGLFIALAVLLTVLSCNKLGTAPLDVSINPTNIPDSVSTDFSPALPNEATATPMTKSLRLNQIPLYWFAPLPPLSVNEGRPFIGSEDYMDLFTETAEWDHAVEYIQVFKLYGEWVAYQATDEELRIVLENIEQRGLAVAVEVGPLNPSPECGQNIEGFAGIEEGIHIANRIKNAGGTIHLIGMDEPYFYGHFYSGTNACRWSAEKIASEIDTYINEVRKIFPEVIIGDTEPLTGPADASAYRDWMDLFREVNGYDLAFIHMDIDWSRPGWSDEVKLIEEHGRKTGIPVGIIYTGNSFDKSDEDWLSAAGERVKKHEVANGGSPEHVLFQSWNDKPDFLLPDSEPFTFTGFINLYFTDKEKLGFLREGVGANLALNKPVRVSNLTGDLLGLLAVDGDLGTLWSSGGDAPQWIEIDLGAEYNINEIRMTPSQFPEGRT